MYEFISGRVDGGHGTNIEGGEERVSEGMVGNEVSNSDVATMLVTEDIGGCQLGSGEACSEQWGCGTHGSRVATDSVGRD